MIQGIIRSVRGYVKIRVEGYSPERFLNLCSHHKIYIWGLTPCGGAYEMFMSLRGFRRLRPIVRKTHTKIVLVKRYGLPFFIHNYKNRKTFFFSFILCVGLLFLYSNFIWDIHFEGNEKWTNKTLLEFLEKKDVSPFMLKNKVDCARIVKDIRAQYNDIVWVSASVDGSRLTIQVKENEDTFHEADEAVQNKTPTDLVAQKDGVITDMITRAGTPMVHVGDTVAKGTVLVKGQVPVMNDAGEVTGYQYQHSDADILADTQQEYEDTISTKYKQKNYEKSTRWQLYLKIGDYLCTAGILNNDYKECETKTKEHRLKLGENFYLPVSYGSKVIRSYTFQEKTYTKEELQKRLSQNFHQFSKELQEKGIQITGNSVKIHIDQNSASAKGTLNLNEKLGKTADTEIIEIERKEQDESLRTDD